MVFILIGDRLIRILQLTTCCTCCPCHIFHEEGRGRLMRLRAKNMEQHSLKRKYELISMWLEDIFSGGVPQFEISDTTISYFLEIRSRNLKMNSIILNATDHVNSKQNEYREETERLKSILEGVGLPVQSLSLAGKTALKTLCDLAVVLDIKDVKTSSYCAAMFDLQTELNNTIQKVTEKKNELQALMAATSMSLKQITKMKQSYCKMEESFSIDEPIVEKRQKDILVLQEKCHGYDAHIQESKGNLWKNIDQELNHDKLIQLAEDLAGLKKELQPLAKKFQNYRSLPPDLDLAKVKIEEQKRQLKKLEKELQTDIELMAL